MKVFASIVVLVAFFCYQAISSPQRRKQVQAEYFNGKCLEANARYAVSDQCDAYVECSDGEAEHKLCSDGLMFNDKAGVFTFPCQYPIDVNCSTRARLQPPQATEECPHQFGYFKLGDESQCGDFLNCADGRGYKLSCPLGLAFNKETYQCDWPDLVPDCNAEAYLRFTCPPETKEEGFGLGQTKFLKSDDCQRYFLCNGGHPRLHVCGVGSAFAEELNRCEAAENVTGCEHLAVTEEPETERPPIYLKTLKIQG